MVLYICVSTIGRILRIQSTIINYVKFGKCSPPVRPPGEELIRKCRFDELIGLFKKVAIEQPKIEINIEKKTAAVEI